jgi:hypothetical protein
MKKSIVIGIICLFIGVSFQSVIAEETNTPIKRNQNEDCGCEHFDNLQLERIGVLIDRLKVYSKFLLLSSRNYPVVYDICLETSNELNTISEKYEELSYNLDISKWSYPIICSILNVLMIIPLILFAFGSSLGALGLWFRLIGLIGNVIVMITVPIIYAIINVGTKFDCNWWFIST